MAGEPRSFISDMARPGVPEEQMAAVWLAIILFTAFSVVGLGLIAAWPAMFWLEAPSPQAWTAETGRFLQALYNDPRAVFALYKEWYRGAMSTTGWPPIAWLCAFGAGAMVVAVGLARNPFHFSSTEHGSARFATDADLIRDHMFAPTGIILGRRQKRLIRNHECLSAMLIAPPGTAKTVQLISNILADWPDRFPVRWCGIPLPWTRPPNIRAGETPGPCMIINDPKGEMYEKTAGWRSRLGPVFKISWGDAAGSHRWNPLSPRAYPSGMEGVACRLHVLDALSEIYESPEDVINKLLVAARDGGPQWHLPVAEDPDGFAATSPLPDVPPRKLSLLVERTDAGRRIRDLAPDVVRLRTLMSEREAHIDRMCTILIPDSIEAHWRNTGREFLAGAIGYIIAHCERTGIEPSFGRLLDALNGTTGGNGFKDMEQGPTGEVYETDGGARPVFDTGQVAGLGSPNQPTGGDVALNPDDPDDDLVARLLDDWLEECIFYGYPDRIANDLRATRQKPDRERGSVVSTAGSAINMFKNAEVRAVTSTCDFGLSDVRGIGGRPFTLYLVTKLQDAEVHGRLNGLFLDTHAAFAISQDEGEIRKTRPILVIVDEFWTLPPLQALLQIPALGRGQWVMAWIVGQSRGQIATKYRQAGGEQVIDTLESSLSYKIIPTQNDHATAKRISESIGNTTKRQRSIGKQGFDLSAVFDQHGGSRQGTNFNYSLTGMPLLRPEDIMSQEKLDPPKGRKGYQIVQTVGRMNRPIVCRPIVWFWHPILSKRAGLSVQEWPGTATAPQEAIAAPRHFSANAQRLIEESV